MVIFNAVATYILTYLGVTTIESFVPHPEQQY